MNDLLQNLRKLQALDFNETTSPDAGALKADLRTRIPQPILGHYDRLVARGKKGLAVVRNQVCSGCHMRLPIGVVNTVMQGNDIQICDSCGRYLCLPDESEAKAAEAPPVKPVKKTRSRKVASHAI